MKKFAIASFIAVLAAHFSPMSLAQDAGPVLLKPKFTIGKTYQYRQGMEMKMQIPLGGAGESATTMQMDLTMKVEKAPDGENKLVRTRFDRVRMQMNMVGQNLVYDSGDPAKQNPLLKAAFAGFSDKEYKAIYDKDNQFVRLDGAKAGGAAAGGALGGLGVSDAQVEQILRQMTDYGFPKTPIAAGDTWKHIQKADMAPVGEVSVDMDFVFKGLVDRDGVSVAEIHFTGTMDGGGGEEGARVTFKDSSMSGKMFFDPALGLIRYSEMDSKMTMSVGGEAGAEMDTKSRSTYELLTVE